MNDIVLYEFCIILYKSITAIIIITTITIAIAIPIPITIPITIYNHHLATGPCMKSTTIAEENPQIPWRTNVYQRIG